jgi:hypothetical protein
VGGYTLLELLVASGLLVLMGAGLVSLLSQGVSIWRVSEGRGRAYERARAVLDRVSDDLRSAIGRAVEPEGSSWVRFIADEGPGGRQRLRFARTISGEASDAILREGGKYLATRTPAVVDGVADSSEAEAGLLAAPGGALEVLYMMDPRPGERALWRGYRSPVGGPGSLFVDKNLQEPPPAPPSRASIPRKPSVPPVSGQTSPSVTDAAADASAEAAAPAPPPPFYMEEFAAPLSAHLLYVGFRFWTPETNTWRDVPPLEDPGEGAPSGPTALWDSTRAILDSSAWTPSGGTGSVRSSGSSRPSGSRVFAWTPRAGSLGDPTDDVFPERVEVTVVVPADYAPGEARLAQPLTENDRTFTISGSIEIPEGDLDRYVLVDDEWIAVEEVQGSQIKVLADGRGRRWTQPAKHEAGALLEVGLTFRRVVDMPAGGGGPWRAVEAAPTRGRGFR